MGNVGLRGHEGVEMIRRAKISMHCVFWFTFIAFAAVATPAAADCLEYDLLQLSILEKGVAFSRGLPTEICQPCGRFGQLACGPDNGRSCGGAREVYPNVRGLTERVTSKVRESGKDFLGIGEGIARRIADRLRFCLEPVTFPRRTPHGLQLPATAGTTRRTYLFFPGMGGSLPSGEFKGANNPIRRLVQEAYQRVYAVDINAGGKEDAEGLYYPLRIFDIGHDGEQDEVYRGRTPITGRNVDFQQIAAEVARALRALPLHGTVTVVGYSMGGYLAKELVYNHYESLLQGGVVISEVIFTAHPHFAERAVSGADMATLFCSGLADGTLLQGVSFEGSGSIGNASGASSGSATASAEASQDGSEQASGGSDGTANVFAQSCYVGRWLDGWSRLMQDSRRTGGSVRTIDDRDFPAIVWTSLAGKSAKLEPSDNDFYPEPVWSDGRTPVDSALGIDAFDRFPNVSRLSWDHSGVHDCEHRYDCLLNHIFADLPIGPPRPGVPYRVLPHDSLWSVALRAMRHQPEEKPSPEMVARVDAYWRLLADANGLDVASGGGIHPGQFLEMPVIRRVIGRGDTLWQIAVEQGIESSDWRALHSRHPATFDDNPDLIFPGRMLME